MPRQQDDTDLLWCSHGDLFIDEDTGDLSDTYGIFLRSTTQRVSTRVRHAGGDYPSLSSSLAANLKSFKGLPNNPETATNIKRRVESALTSDGLFDGGSVQVEVLPLTRISLAIIVKIRTYGPNASVATMSFAYNTDENTVQTRTL